MKWVISISKGDITKDIERGSFFFFSKEAGMNEKNKVTFENLVMIAEKAASAVSEGEMLEFDFVDENGNSDPTDTETKMYVDAIKTIMMDVVNDKSLIDLIKEVRNGGGDAPLSPKATTQTSAVE